MIPPDLDAAFRRQQMKDWEARLRQTCEPPKSFANYYQALRDSVKNYQYGNGGVVPSRTLQAQRSQCPTCGEIIYVCHVTEEFTCSCGQKLKRRQ